MLVGEIKERETRSRRPRFARLGAAQAAAPPVTRTGNAQPATASRGPSSSGDALKDSISQENERILASMSESQIADEVRFIENELGLSADILKMLRRNEESASGRPSRKSRDERGTTTQVETPDNSASSHDAVSHDAVPPKRDPPQSSSGFSAHDLPHHEAIRQQFFPNEPADNPALQWMDDSAEPGSDVGETPAYALDGSRTHGHVTAMETTPDVLAAGSHASSSNELSLPRLLALLSSSVTAQKASALQVIAKVLVTDDEALTNVPMLMEVLRCAGPALVDSSLSVRQGAVNVVGTALKSRNLFLQPADPSAHVPDLTDTFETVEDEGDAPNDDTGLPAPRSAAEMFLATSPLFDLHLTNDALWVPLIEGLCTALQQNVHGVRTRPVHVARACVNAELMVECFVASTTGIRVDWGAFCAVCNLVTQIALWDRDIAETLAEREIPQKLVSKAALFHAYDFSHMIHEDNDVFFSSIRALLKTALAFSSYGISLDIFYTGMAQIISSLLFRCTALPGNVCGDLFDLMRIWADLTGRSTKAAFNVPHAHIQDWTDCVCDFIEARGSCEQAAKQAYECLASLVTVVRFREQTMAKNAQAHFSASSPWSKQVPRFESVLAHVKSNLPNAESPLAESIMAFALALARFVPDKIGSTDLGVVFNAFGHTSPSTLSTPALYSLLQYRQLTGELDVDDGSLSALVELASRVKVHDRTICDWTMRRLVTVLHLEGLPRFSMYVKSVKREPLVLDAFMPDAISCMTCHTQRSSGEPLIRADWILAPLRDLEREARKARSADVIVEEENDNADAFQRVTDALVRVQSITHLAPHLQLPPSVVYFGLLHGLVLPSSMDSLLHDENVQRRMLDVLLHVSRDTSHVRASSRAFGHYQVYSHFVDDATSAVPTPHLASLLVMGQLQVYAPDLRRRFWNDTEPRLLLRLWTLLPVSELVSLRDSFVKRGVSAVQDFVGEADVQVLHAQLRLFMMACSHVEGDVWDYALSRICAGNLSRVVSGATRLNTPNADALHAHFVSAIQKLPVSLRD